MEDKDDLSMLAIGFNLLSQPQLQQVAQTSFLPGTVAKAFSKCLAWNSSY